jgi:ribulose-5-phosphate 4-epimerase/fuculose-1-phosphate aldolase
MNASDYLDLSFRPAHIAPDEWQARVELAACYRIIAELGWTELIYNHQTLRLPGPEQHFLINPFGLLYHEIRASDLVKIDVNGNLVGDSGYGVNPAGFAIHGVLHQNVAGAHCVLHIHTTACMAVACMREGLRMDNFYSAMLYGQIAYHDFERLIFTPEEGQRLIRDCAGKHCVILRNHGLLVQAPTVPIAFAYLWTLVRACEVQVATASMGGDTINLERHMGAEAARLTLHWNSEHRGADLFAAMTRQIDAKDQSYKT